MTSALIQACLTGEVGTELPHDVGVTLTRQLLSHRTVVLLHEGGERRGASGFGRSQEDQLTCAESAHELLRVQGLGVASDPGGKRHSRSHNFKKL